MEEKKESESTKPDELETVETYKTADERGKFNGVVRHWFAAYNPVCFFSALCVLAGVFFVSRGLMEMKWRNSEIILNGVVQLYEFLLIGAAFLLFNFTRQKRQAVILALLEMCFILDWTFRTEVLIGLGKTGIIVSTFWAALFGVKLFFMMRIFGIVKRFSMLIPAVSAGVAICLTPHLIA